MTPKNAKPRKPMPDGAELLRIVREDAEDFRAFLDGLEKVLDESLKNDPPMEPRIAAPKRRKRAAGR